MCRFRIATSRLSSSSRATRLRSPDLRRERLLGGRWNDLAPLRRRKAPTRSSRTPTGRSGASCLGRPTVNPAVPARRRLRRATRVDGSTDRRGGWRTSSGCLSLSRPLTHCGLHRTSPAALLTWVWGRSTARRSIWAAILMNGRPGQQLASTTVILMSRGAHSPSIDIFFDMGWRNQGSQGCVFRQGFRRIRPFSTL
jgi:hypothetical protein